MATVPSPVWLPNSTVPYPDQDNQDGNRPAQEIASYYLPTTLTEVHWAIPNVVLPNVDIDFCIPIYDWYNRVRTVTFVSGPAGVTIEADFHVHFTPPTDSTNHTIVVSVKFDGGSEILKSLPVVVDSSRCLVISTTGNDTTGDGSVSTPYATLAPQPKRLNASRWPALTRSLVQTTWPKLRSLRASGCFSPMKRKVLRNNSAQFKASGVVGLE